MGASGGKTSRQETEDLDLKFSDLSALGATGGLQLEECSAATDYLSCENHPGERIAAYCDTCDTPVCFKCWNDPKHVSHSGMSFKEWQEKAHSSSNITGINEPIIQQARAKQQKLKDLKAHVKSGHKSEIKGAQAKARGVLKSLKVKFDREVQVLEDALEEQTGLVKKLLSDQLGKIHTSLNEQLRRIQEAEKKIDNVVDGLQKPARETQDSGSGASQKEERRGEVAGVNKAVADVRTVNVVSNQLKTEDFTPLEHFPAKVTTSNRPDDASSSASASPATGKGVSAGTPGARAVIPADRVPSLRSRIDALTPRDVTHNNNCGQGAVVITREYHISCREFADGKSAIFPGPMQCPDLRKPYSWHYDVTFIPPDDAAALCEVVGGKPALTRGDNCSWLLDKKLAFRLTRLYDEKGNRVPISGKASNAFCCNLPVGETFHNAIEKYAGFYPSVVKEKSTGKVIENTVTVGSWKSGLDDVNVIAIE